VGRIAVVDHDSGPRDLALELNRLIVAAEGRGSQSRGSVKRATLARRIGVSASSLYAYLDGTTLPTTVTLDRLLHELGAPDAVRQRLAATRDAIDVDRRLRRRPADDGVPHELPPDVFGFTGRRPELAELAALLGDPAAESAVPIVVVSGVGGVGKTALVVHHAHQSRHRFPDGELYADLRGYGPQQPADPGEVLGTFLRSLGVPAADMPADLDGRVARYRSQVHGRRLMVLLDNAFSADQARPLLPGSPSCRVLVTSRDGMGGLVARDGARRLVLAPLPQDTSVELLRRLVDPARTTVEPEAATQLAGLCVGLPLAIRVAAEHAASRTEPLADLVAELRSHRLDGLRTDGDERTAVRTVFSWSYHRLPPDTARTFRTIGLFPGRDFTVRAIAAATGATDAPRLADELVDAHLLERHDDRFRLHDLLRDYAAELAAADPPAHRSAALRALMDHYLAAAATAVDLLHTPEPRRRRVPLDPDPAITTPTEAETWLAAERPNLMAAAALATHDWPDHVVDLATVLWRHLYQRGHHVDAIALQDFAITALGPDGAPADRTDALINKANLNQQLARYPEAIADLRQAIDLAEQAAYRPGQGRASTALGVVQSRLYQHAEAVANLTRALTYVRETGSPAGEARVLTNLASAYGNSGQPTEAIDCFQQALTLAKEIGDRAVTAAALSGLCCAQQELANHDQAVHYGEQALTLARSAADRHGELDALSNLGLSYTRLGDRTKARKALTKALTLARDMGKRRIEADTHNTLGELNLATGNHSAALHHHQTALTLATEIGDPHQQDRAQAGVHEATNATMSTQGR
jgi:tetratricopeptide (TPR) repeat protein/transcriptional regulator with XRE-family HTH domain